MFAKILRYKAMQFDRVSKNKHIKNVKNAK